MIELLVVLTIIGITAAISAGRIHALMIQHRIARAATAVRNDVEGAFTIAIRNRKPTRITWNSATMQLAVTNRSGSTTYRHTALGRDSYGLTTNAVSFSSSPIEVYPNGMASDQLTITFQIENVSKTVRMSRAGLVEVK